MEWVWASGDGVEEDVLLFDLVPATTPQMGESEAELICHSKDVVVIDEPSSWPGMVSWEAPEDEWTSPANRVVGGQFPYTGLGVCTRNSRRRAWRHSMVCTLKDNRCHSRAIHVLREQFRELNVPWGNTTPGPPAHPTLLLGVFLNMESNCGILLF